MLRGTINALRELGAEPFVVPAMGSHGGATAPGQMHMLESLGMTEESLGCEIRATMDTVVIAHTAAGTPVHLDANAAAADRYLPVNRIKPHTCFKGPIESGCMKMAVVGFGKRPGAFLVHSCGPRRDARSPARRLRRDQVDRAPAGRDRLDRVDRLATSCGSRGSRPTTSAASSSTSSPSTPAASCRRCRSTRSTC